MDSIAGFKTDRLVATRVAHTDLADLCRMHRDALVMATLGGVRTDERTWQFLETNIRHWVDHGFGLWIFRDPQQTFVGRGGLRHVQIGGRDEVELAYAVMSEYWSRGIATEMARSLLSIGFEQLGLAQLVAFTPTTNHASRRVMEKVGFAFERELVHGDARLPHVLYRITRNSLERRER